MVIRGDSVPLFLGGAGGWRSGIIYIQLLSTYSQKGRLKIYTGSRVIKVLIFKVKGLPQGAIFNAIFSNRKLPISAVRMRGDVITEFLHS